MMGPGDGGYLRGLDMGWLGVGGGVGVMEARDGSLKVVLISG